MMNFSSIIIFNSHNHPIVLELLSSPRYEEFEAFRSKIIN